MPHRTPLLLRLATRAWPRGWRERHGRSFVQTLSTAWDAAAAEPPVRRMATRTALLVDAVRSGLAARRAREVRPTARRPRFALMRGAGWDVRVAARGLRRDPLFTASVVGTLGLGLGAATAMFTVVNAVLLTPLPYPADHRLVTLGERDTARNSSGASFPALAEWAAFPEVASVGAYTERLAHFRRDGVPERVAGVSVSPGFFQTLGVSAAVGRTMLPGEPLLDPDPKIVLSDAAWHRFFDAAPGVVGRSIVLDERSFTVIGVMPPRFDFPAGAQFWTTLPANMSRLVEARSLRFGSAVARLADGHRRDALARRVEAWHAVHAPAAAGTLGPELAGEWRPFVIGLRDEMVGPVRPALVAVFAGVVLLLVVACANVAALMLARGRARQHELAVQASLGASRGRLLQQRFVEGLLLAAAGAGAALLLAHVTRDGIIALSADRIPRIADLWIDWRVAGFAACAGLVVTLAITLGPAMVLTRRPGRILGRYSRGAAGSRAGRRAFGALVAFEFAAAMVLVAGAGLLINSYRHLGRVDTGVAPSAVGLARVSLPFLPQWQSNENRRRFHDDLLARVARVPGVTSAALVNRLPLQVVGGGIDVAPDDQPDRRVRALLQIASEGYFETIGARLTQGPDFETRDDASAPLVAVINDRLAALLFPGRDPVGRRVAFRNMTGPKTATIAGVVHAIRYNDLRSELQPELYLSFRQGTVVPMQLAYRSSMPPTTVVTAVRAALAEADPSATVTLDDISTFDARLSAAFAQPRFYLVLVGVFASIALLLAALGIHGTLSYWVNERRRELGIRLSLGATPGQISRLVVSRGLGIAGLGLAAGLAVTLGSGRFISHLLFGVAPTDAATLVAASLSLAVAALISCALPARRAGRVDPIEALRAE